MLRTGSLLESLLVEAHAFDMWPAGFQKFHDEWKKRKGAYDLYVRFTDRGDTLDRSTNKKPDHSDPVGTYAYPLKYVIDNPADIWYGHNSKFVQVIQDNSRNKLLLPSLSWSEVENYSYRMGFREATIRAAKKAYKDRAKGAFGPGKIFMTIVQMDFSGDTPKTRPGVEQTALLRRAGFDAIEDTATNSRKAAINDREPEQICWLTPTSFKILSSYRLADPQPNTSKVVMNFERLKKKFASAIAETMGDKLSEWDGRDRFWTKGERQITVKERDASIQWKMKNLKMGEKPHKFSRKEDPHEISAEIKTERGNFHVSFLGDRMEDEVFSFYQRWHKAVEAQSPEKYSKGRFEKEAELEKQKAHEAHFQKMVKESVGEWEGFVSLYGKLSTKMQLPSLPSLSDPMDVYNSVRAITQVARGMSIDKETENLYGIKYPKELRPVLEVIAGLYQKHKPEGRGLMSIMYHWIDKMTPPGEPRDE